ncbi:hypothetical protein SAMN05445756_1555 [Kytococcus aerolatus]|uniref:Uncharacterized protein n=1 Tax=Kytococcus aerolatus TaxID=592308 RepID=A0A212U0F0_9MICO|nr:hypothetical protein [Kytococcus aerolatus]SNC71606.1 hypothetical protein SAMN05445756_1555 [Kytococcus aerolatus]
MSRVGGAQPVIELPAAEHLQDLATFVGRAKRIDPEGAIRLVAEGGRLTTWVCAVPGAGLTGQGTVLGMRAVEAEVSEPVDLVVPLAALTDRFAAHEPGARTLSVPPSEVRAAWASVTPPRTGWEPVARVDVADLEELARQGAAEVAAGAPEGSGAAAVADLRRRVWSRPVGSGWPQGLAFAASTLGLLADATETVVLRSGPWWRCSAPHGHALAR